MTDRITTEERSIVMSRIRSKNTTPELLVRKSLFSRGFRYRIHDKKLYGKPDIVLKKYNTVVFVHGCFWHQHEECKYYRLPKSNQDYWKPKLNRNKERFKEVREKLESDGWNVMVVWECETKNIDKLVITIDDITNGIMKQLRN